MQINFCAGSSIIIVTLLSLGKKVRTYQGRSEGGGGEGGPELPVTPLCKPSFSKQPTTFRGEKAKKIMFDTV